MDPALRPRREEVGGRGLLLEGLYYRLAHSGHVVQGSLPRREEKVPPRIVRNRHRVPERVGVVSDRGWKIFRETFTNPDPSLVRLVDEAAEALQGAKVG